MRASSPKRSDVEFAEPLDDVVVPARDAEPEALRMERAVAHEVADELREFCVIAAARACGSPAFQWSSPSGGSSTSIGLSDDAVEHQRHAVAPLDLGEPPPNPAAVRRDDLDPVGRRALDPVAAAGLDRDDLLEPVDVELRRLPRASSVATSRSRSCHFEPDRIAEAAEPARARGSSRRGCRRRGSRSARARSPARSGSR